MLLKVCNEFAGQKFVTEDILAQFLACTLQKIAEMNKKQEEKIREYISEYHKYMKEQFVKQQQGVNIRQGRIENLLREIRENQGLFRGFKRWIRQF